MTRSTTRDIGPRRAPEGVDLRVVYGAVIALLLLALIVHPVVVEVLQFFRGGRPAETAAAQFPELGSTRHWLDPSADLTVTRRRERERLSTYAWIDRQAGVVRIPIDRAMELLVERGTASGDAKEGLQRNE